MSVLVLSPFMGIDGLLERALEGIDEGEATDGSSVEDGGVEGFLAVGL